MYFVIFSSTVAFEEFFLRSRKAWRPLIKLFLTPVGLQVVKCVHWKVSVGLRCESAENIFFLKYNSPSHTCIQESYFCICRLKFFASLIS